MRAISLLYHDVVPTGDFGASGFPGSDADMYKVEVPQFARHLAAIGVRIHRPPVTVLQLSQKNAVPVLLTFDDGGSSAHEYIADLLEAKGWRGHFFVTTNWIEKAGFLSAQQIRDLAARGHLIGSHSCSHPSRMAYCSREQLQQEWNRSVAALSDILGKAVTLASVPGGFYAPNVAKTAAEAGITTLFTSEPQTRVQLVHGCAVMGRYTIQQGVRAATAAAIASGEFVPRYRQLAFWNAKKVAKAAGGTSWLRIRKWILATRSRAA